jgi:hypothetical protein
MRADEAAHCHQSVQYGPGTSQFVAWVTCGMTVLEPILPPVPVLSRDRGRWIAENAYYRAEKRGFAPGFALEDWLIAEAEVDFLIRRARRRQKIVPLCRPK